MKTKVVLMLIVLFWASMAKAQSLSDVYISSSAAINDLAVSNDASVFIAQSDKIGLVSSQGSSMDFLVPEQIFSIYPLSSTSAWAVGVNLILYFDGYSWIQKTLPCPGIFYRVWGVGGEVFVSGKNGDTAFVLRLENGEFEKVAEYQNSLFLGMSAYGSDELYIAGSYTSPSDNLEHPAIFLLAGDSLSKLCEISSINHRCFNDIGKSISGDFYLSTSDHYYGDSDLWFFSPGSSPYALTSSSLCRNFCSSGSGQLFLAHANGIEIFEEISSTNSNLIYGVPCFDVEYNNGEIYIVALENSTWKVKKNSSSGVIESYCQKEEKNEEVFYYDLMGRLVSLDFNCPAGIYLKVCGSEKIKIFYKP